MSDELPGRGLGEHLASFIVRGVNQVTKTPDAVYLDTNAWSALIKGDIAPTPLARWLRATGKFLWLARFQMLELSADNRFPQPLVDIVRNLGVVFLDRGQFEFTGAPWYEVQTEMELPLRLTPEAEAEFVRQMRDPQLDRARAQVASDGATFEAGLLATLQALRIDATHGWAQFPEDLERWVEGRCVRFGAIAQPDHIRDPDRYVGLKLSFGVLFVRYILSRQRWQASDYVDYLHVADMAYAATVVTERNLAACFGQLRARSQLRVPEVHTIDWLDSPR